MAISHVSNALAIAKELKSLDCCSNCILRFIDEKNSTSCDKADSIVSDLLDEERNGDGPPNVKVKKSNPCTACLGLLQEPFLQEHVIKTVNEILTSGYDCEEVTFALSLPVALIIRNHSLWLHISNKFDNYYLDKYCDYTTDPTSEDSLMYSKCVISLKDAWKNLAAETIASKVKKVFNNGVDGQFVVNINFIYQANDEEAACMVEMHPDIFEGRENQKRKYHNEIFTRKSVELALNRTDRSLFVTHCAVPPPTATHFLECSSIVCSHESIYIAGRYNKFSRSLSQTPWLINGERRMKSSVEEIIREPVSKKIPHDAIKFASSGREDVDVRTLGRGRPFVLDVQNPRKTKLTFEDFRQIEKEINQSTKQVFVRDLQMVNKTELVNIKAGEQTKTKTYYCFCTVRWCDSMGDRSLVTRSLEAALKGLADKSSFVIKQLTPIRVLHRRPLAVRERTIHWIKGEYVDLVGDNLFFKLQIKVEAGTYIKELVHGDLGRTNPNVSQIIGFDSDILALDVEEVDLPWPPTVNIDLNKI